MSDGSNTGGGPGGTIRRGDSGLTPRQEAILARRVVRAQYRRVGAGELASRSLKRGVELLADHLNAEDPPSITETRRTVECLASLTDAAAKHDAPEQPADQHLHLHGELPPGALEEALRHMVDARAGPNAKRVNGSPPTNGTNGNGA